MEAGADRDAMERALGDVFSVTDRIVEFQQELRSRLAKGIAARLADFLLYFSLRSNHVF